MPRRSASSGSVPARHDGRATIASIDPDPRDPNQRRIRVGRRTVAKLSADAVLSLGLQPGQPWTERRQADVETRIAFEKAWRSALRMLGYRALTRSELEARLTRKRVPPAVVERVTAELSANGWLDDEQVAHDTAQALARRRPAARCVLEERLKARGIDAELAARAASNAMSSQAELEAATTFAQQRLRGLRGLEPTVQARRITGALARRGYDEDLIIKVLQSRGLRSTSD